MERKLIEQKTKEILINVLNLKKTVEELSNEQPLFGTDENPGLFDDSLAVLEVTSVLMSEFELEASDFGEESFKTIGTLSGRIYDVLHLAVI
jgi:acyl carrier protein